MSEDTENLIGKLREIEQQASSALSEIPHGLTNSRVHHILSLARFIRMRLEGQPVAPVEALPENLRKVRKLPPGT